MNQIDISSLVRGIAEQTMQVPVERIDRTFMQRGIANRLLLPSAVFSPPARLRFSSNSCTARTSSSLKATSRKSESVEKDKESEEEEEEKSDEYSAEMQSKMGGFLIYRHEDGMNYAEVLEDMIVGSCLQTPGDLDRLVETENVGSIICLQQDSDMDYFALDIKPILSRAEERRDVHHIRYRINDFDAHDLRMKLPGAAAAVAKEIAQGRRAYIHCTAGLGRAPATALAYMYWYRGFSLLDAFEKLRTVRPCNPRLQAIRQATCDILFHSGKQTPITIAVSRPGSAQRIQVAGLDFGWGNKVDLVWDAKTKRHILQRDLPPGKYPYKFIFDDRWTCSADHPTMQDGDNVNNYVEVVGDVSSARVVAARERLLSEEGNLTDEERTKLVQRLESLAS